MNYNNMQHQGPNRKVRPVSSYNPSMTPQTPTFGMNSITPMNHGISVQQPNISEYPLHYNNDSNIPQTSVFHPSVQVSYDQNSAFSVIQQPIMQDVAYKYGQQLASTGQTLVKREIEKYVPLTSLKYYFAVDTKYVLSKLKLIFFPFTHKDWSVKYEQDHPIQPRLEINAPDLYIPTMAFVTYCIVAGVLLGIQHRFTHEKIGIYASSALAWVAFEIIIYLATTYIFNINTTLRALDLLAFSGYKFVGIIAALLCSVLLSTTGYYVVLAYYNISLGFFLVRTLRTQVTIDGDNRHYAVNPGAKRRLYFLIFIAVMQPLIGWWLSSSIVNIPRNEKI